SSRRRHTSSKRDWSSDVCSSDLISDELPRRTATMIWKVYNAPSPTMAFSSGGSLAITTPAIIDPKETVMAKSKLDILEKERSPRSEERRVGKEYRNTIEQN